MRSERTYNLLALTLTILAWSVILVMFGWVFTATGWRLIYTILDKTLFIPVNVIGTTKILVEIVFWGFAIFIGLYLWANFNRKRYFLNNKRKMENFLLLVEDLPGPEALIQVDESSEDTRNSYISWRSNPVRRKNIDSSPVEMLSCVKVLNKEKAFKDATSLARLIIFNSETNAILRLFAISELKYSLTHMGEDGKRLSESMSLKMEGGYGSVN